MSQGFLPLCRKDMEERGWEQVDFVYVCGDAYVDHPSFGHAVITRLLEAHGWSTASQGLHFWYRREIWTPWSTIIRCRKGQEGQTPIRREA